MQHLEALWQAEKDDPDVWDAEQAFQNAMQEEVRERIEALREQHRAARRAQKSSDDDDFDDDDDVEVVYVP